MDDFAIKVENLSKDFKLPHEKARTVKSAVISFRRRDRGYEIQHALKDINFEIKKGEFFGIVGRNGSGKSTLLKLLAGIYTPTKGQVHIRGSLTPFIELGVGFNPELTGRENVYLNGALLGFNRKEMKAMYEDIVNFSELRKFMDQKLKNYSSGMQVRLAFSIAIRAKSDILLIDEVLAVGDAAFQVKSIRYFRELKKQHKTVVFVSHDMEAVKRFCDRGILLEDGSLKGIGDVQKITRDYLLVFEKDKREEKPPEYRSKNPNERPGNGDVRIDDVKTLVSKHDVTVKIFSKVHNNIGQLSYGLHIAGEDGREIMGFNNALLQQPDIKKLKAGSEVSFEWKLQNVFNTGRYFINLSLVDDSGVRLDDFVDADTFSIKKSQQSTTAILPAINVKHTVK